MQTALSRSMDSAPGADNWHEGTQPDTFGAFVADLAGSFEDLEHADWAASAMAARDVVGRHIGKPDLLDGMRYVMRCTGYSRVLLYADPAGRYSVLGLVWPPGSRTPIHAHHAWCALGLHSGALEEETFMPWQDAETAPGALVASRALDRGQACCDSSAGRFVHRLANPSAGLAMSLHVYGVPEARITDGVNRILYAG